MAINIKLLIVVIYVSNYGNYMVMNEIKDMQYLMQNTIDNKIKRNLNETLEKLFTRMNDVMFLIQKNNLKAIKKSKKILCLK